MYLRYKNAIKKRDYGIEVGVSVRDFSQRKEGTPSPGVTPVLRARDGSVKDGGR